MAAFRTSPSSERVLLHDADHGIASLSGVFVQVRRGPLTLELLEAIAGFARASRLLHRGPGGSLVVLEEEAPMPDGTVRRRQAEIVQSLMNEPTARTALVIVGQGAQASAKRVSARATSQGRTAQIRQFDEIEAAARWVSEPAGVDPIALLTLVERLRRRP